MILHDAPESMMTPTVIPLIVTGEISAHQSLGVSHATVVKCVY